MTNPLDLDAIEARLALLANRATRWTRAWKNALDHAPTDLAALIAEVRLLRAMTTETIAREHERIIGEIEIKMIRNAEQERDAAQAEVERLRAALVQAGCMYGGEQHGCDCPRCCALSGRPVHGVIQSEIDATLAALRGEEASGE